MAQPDLARLAELLAVSTLTLSTVGEGGQPHAAAVYFAADEALNLFFFSDPQSQHSLDVKRDARAAVACYPEVSGWQEIRGVQMRGRVQVVPPGEAWERGWERYRAKFPFVRRLKEIVARNTLYVFVPGWVRLVDNRLGFGHKQEWSLP